MKKQLTMPHFKNKKELLEAVQKRIDYFYQFDDSNDELKKTAEKMQGFFIPALTSELHLIVEAEDRSSILIMSDLDSETYFYMQEKGLGEMEEKSYSIIRWPSISELRREEKRGLYISVEEALTYDFSLLDKWSNQDVKITAKDIAEYIENNWSIDTAMPGAWSSYRIYVDTAGKWYTLKDDDSWPPQSESEMNHLVSFSLIGDYAPYSPKMILSLIEAQIHGLSDDRRGGRIGPDADGGLSYRIARYGDPA